MANLKRRVELGQHTEPELDQNSGGHAVIDCREIEIRTRGKSKKNACTVSLSYRDVVVERHDAALGYSELAGGFYDCIVMVIARRNEGITVGPVFCR